MTYCPACLSEAPDSSRFCPSCGEAIGTGSAAATIGPALDSSSSWTSSSSIEEGRFPSGTMLADRYRIVARLGKGGMGEVYRAEDLKLGQLVALKFLPEELAANQEMLARFHHEVKIARQVSHPNVCRVHDIGEVDGHVYLSMEYVDGEDLRTLLRRIGRLPEDKAIQIARQLCAGLAAAHDKGVLHRDLKPANVMLDGEGRVRITDFGLAGIAGEIQGKEIRSGTPTYMAPEQLAGKGVSVTSDIYALGLVLFELFTGKPALKASSIQDLIRIQQEEEPTSPSSLVDIDPAVERVILRCLARTPGERPSSALAVAAALPGGDPLAAALAAGETPSPEVVAAAGVVGGLRLGVAWPCLAGILAGLGLIVAFSEPGLLTSRTALPEKPDVLAASARSLLEEIGYEEAALDSQWAFQENVAYLEHLEEVGGANRWDRLDEGARSGLLFWYRQSPRLLVPFQQAWPPLSRVDPPPTFPGMAEIVTDPEGQLVSLRVVPPERDETPGESSGETDWTTLLARAGFEEEDLTPVAPVWLPPVHSDTRVAWEGTFTGAGDDAVRVEGASYGGLPVFFRVMGDWIEPEEAEETQGSGERAAQFIGIVLLLSILVGAMLLARRNKRLKRCDHRGALRIAVFFVVAHTLVWLLRVKHFVQLNATLAQFFSTVAFDVFVGILLYVGYLALEPYVRRRWPDTIISWTRVLSGRLRDPLVGRDILFGTLSGIALTLAIMVNHWLPLWLDLAPRRPHGVDLARLLGTSHAFGAILDNVVHAIQPGMMILILFLILTAILRKEWIAAGFIVLVIGFQSWATSDYWFDGLIGAVLGSLILLAVTRLGLLAASVMFFVLNLCSDTAFTSDIGAWHSTPTMLAILSIVALAGFGFYTSLAGRPIFADALLQE